MIGNYIDKRRVSQRVWGELYEDIFDDGAIEPYVIAVLIHRFSTAVQPGTDYGIRLRLSMDVRCCSPHAKFPLLCSLCIVILRCKSSALLHSLLHISV